MSPEPSLSATLEAALGLSPADSEEHRVGVALRLAAHAPALQAAVKLTEMMVPLEVYGLMRRAIEAAGSQAAYAAKVGISATFLSDALNGRKEIPVAVLTDLGLQRIVRYRRKEAVTNG